jgi:hypothetical protein
MSSYGHLEIAGYLLTQERNYIDPLLMTMFQDSERESRTRLLSERNPMMWGEWEDGEEDTEETAFEYSTTVRIAIQRLEIMGFTLHKAQEEFEAGVSSSIEFYQREQEWHRLFPSEGVDSLRDHTETRLRLYRSLTFDIWMRLMEQVIAKRLKQPSPIDEIQFPYVKLLLWDEDFAFEYSDIRYFLRAILELFEADELLILDYTELVHAGYYSEQDALRDLAIEELSEGFATNQKVVILTEGSTDTLILRRTLDVLYPHLRDFYSFVDFSAANLAGGAGALANTVKTFVGSGIQNRAVALFDNDTAAKDALRALSSVELPDNVKVVQLPTLDLAEDYPTIGPQGRVNININGLACSIELYFGSDVLADPEHGFVPIQWKGYNQTLSQYQGEILDKSRLQERYLRIVSEAEASQETKNSHDWDPMAKVFETLFEAFR